jgi:hypothetical protein
MSKNKIKTVVKRYKPIDPNKEASNPSGWKKACLIMLEFWHSKETTQDNDYLQTDKALNSKK